MSNAEIYLQQLKDFESFVRRAIPCPTKEVWAKRDEFWRRYEKEMGLETIYTGPLAG